MNEMQKQFLREGRNADVSTEFAVLDEFGNTLDCESLEEARTIVKNSTDALIILRHIGPWTLR